MTMQVRLTLAQAWSLALAPMPNRMTRLATKKRALKTQLASVQKRATLQLVQDESEVTLSSVVRRPRKTARLKREKRTAPGGRRGHQLPAADLGCPPASNAAD
jgi:hypothetical protein